MPYSPIDVHSCAQAPTFFSYYNMDMGDTFEPIMTGAPNPTGKPDQAESKNPSEQPHACAITLNFDEQSGLVHAHLAPSKEAKPISVGSLRTQIKTAGFGAFYTPEASLAAIVKSANNCEPGVFLIAERRDATTEWRVSSDKQAVYLTLRPAWGGEPMTRQTIMEELAHLAVPDDCIIEKAVDELILAGKAENSVVARAVAPTQGKDARFKLLIDSGEDMVLVADSTGRIDMRQIHSFLAADANTPLMRRIPATAGRPGINVVGETLPAKTGKDFPFAKECSGTHLDPTNPNILLSSIKGHPVVLAQGVRVDPVLKIKRVDLSTGNIDFDGSVEIAGDVTSGFMVKATGDILVRGMVEQARVSAGNDLTIIGGVMGEHQGHDKEGRARLGARLKAGQNFSAKFINLAEVSAGVDLHVREYALHCHLFAGRDLLLGQPTGKGNLIGGLAKARRALIANILGSAANVATSVQVGRAPRRKRLLNALRRELELCNNNWNRLTAMLAAVDKSKKVKLSEQRRERAQQAQDALLHRRNRLQSLIERITAPSTAVEPWVQIKRQLHANTTVTVGGARHLFSSDQGPCQLIRSGVELVKK